jgi:hypothetical protein
VNFPLVTTVENKEGQNIDTADGTPETYSDKGELIIQDHIAITTIASPSVGTSSRSRARQVGSSPRITRHDVGLLTAVAAAGPTSLLLAWRKEAARYVSGDIYGIYAHTTRSSFTNY